MIDSVKVVVRVEVLVVVGTGDLEVEPYWVVQVVVVAARIWLEVVRKRAKSEMILSMSNIGTTPSESIKKPSCCPNDKRRNNSPFKPS